MAVARLDASASAAASTLNYTVSAGSDRCLIVCFGSEYNGSTSVTSVDYGGQAMVQAFSIQTADSGYAANTSCWYLLDAGITAASGNTITPTYSTTPADEMITAASYTGVNQTGGASTVLETATAESNESTPNPFTTIDLTEASGNLVVAAITCGNATTFTWAADMTEQEDLADASSAMSFADRLSTTNANVTIEATVASQNRASAGSAEFAAAPVFSLEQEGYRWYDDGTESGSSARQSQDTVDTVERGVTVHLRVLIDATGDPDSSQFQLEYKETSDPDAEYRKVPLS